MEVKAKLKSLRMSPRKVRLVVDLIRGQKVAAALNQLSFSDKWSAKPLAKLLQSAIANAKNNFGLAEDNLYVKEISVDGGATLKRWMPRAHGRATPIGKRTSHINLVLAEVAPSQPAAVQPAVAAKPVKTNKRPAEAEGLKVVAKEAIKPATAEQGKEIVDVHREGQGKHTKIEGGKRGFTTKVFRRKSG
jgi:large subunit ribosomal protein L22